MDSTSDSAIRSLLETEPFTVHMPHGREYDVENPERAALSPHGGTLYLYTPTGEWRAVLSLDHVVRVTFPARPLIRGE